MNKSIAIYGSGKAGRFVLDFCNNYDIPVCCFFDDDPKHWGKKLGQVEILDTSRAPEMQDQYGQIVIASFHFEHIMYSKLIALGLQRIVFIRDFPFHRKQEELAKPARSLPGMFINSMPKSGTMNIQHVLFGCFHGQIGHIDLSSGGWPFDNLHEPAVRALVGQGNCYCVNHCQPRETNIWDLEDFGPKKMIVHVRDPRQALLSLVHWTRKLQGDRLLRRYETPPNPDFFQLSISEQIDELISFRYSNLVDFVRLWHRVARDENSPITILLTEFRTMKNDPARFYQSIFDFFEIEPDSYQIPILDTEESRRHFRKGIVDEWKQVFTDQQKQLTTDMIPKDLLTYFDW